MKRNLRRNSRDRCVACGLRVVLHFDANNYKLSCEEAAEAHRCAGIRFRPLRELMLKSIGQAVTQPDGSVREEPASGRD